MISIGRCFSSQAAVTTWKVTVWHQAKGVFDKEAWMACTAQNSTFFFSFPLLAGGTCGKQALYAVDIQRSPCFGDKTQANTLVRQFPEFPIYCFHHSFLLSLRESALSPTWGSFIAAWVSRWAELSPPLRISELVRSKYCFSWSLIPKSYNPAPWLPAWTSPQKGQGCFSGLAHWSWAGLSFFLPEFPTSWFLTLTPAKWQGHW